MFTKTILSLALFLGTASNAFAATKHESASSDRSKHSAGVTDASDPIRRDRANFVVGNMVFVGLHEMGHTMVDQLRLPLLGRSEDAADSFATLALLEEGSEFSVNVLVQAARGLFLMHSRDRALGESLVFSDAHGLDRQRAFQIVCLMVGSDRSKFKDLANWVRLPEDRQNSCRDDYDDAKHAWKAVLLPHLRSAGQPRAEIEVAYEESERQVADYANSIRSIGFLEALAEHMSSRYALPQPIRLVMLGCDDPNAWWNPPTVTASFCYELVEDFSELYRGYAGKTMTQWNTQVNTLVAAGASPARDTSNGNIEVAPVGAETEITRDPMWKLAMDLKVGAPALFAQAANRQSAMRARSRTSKN
jgi:hypothetical protein